MSKQNHPMNGADHQSISSNIKKIIEKLHGPIKRIEKINEPLRELAQRQQSIYDFANRMAATSVVQPSATQSLADALISKDNLSSNLNHNPEKLSPLLSLDDCIASEHKAQQRAIEAQAKANAEAFKIVIDEILQDHSRQTNDFEEKLSIRTVFLTVILTAIVTSILPELTKGWRSSYFEKHNIEQNLTIRDIRPYEDF